MLAALFAMDTYIPTNNRTKEMAQGDSCSGRARARHLHSDGANWRSLRRPGASSVLAGALVEPGKWRFEVPFPLNCPFILDDPLPITLWPNPYPRSLTDFNLQCKRPLQVARFKTLESMIFCCMSRIERH